MRFTVGEMAKLNRISAKTLRCYDRIDLFKPAYVDDNTCNRVFGFPHGRCQSKDWEQKGRTRWKGM